MTDQELAQAVSDRINAAEAAAEAAGDKRLLLRLRRAHAHLDKARLILLGGGEIQPLTGSGLKP